MSKLEDFLAIGKATDIQEEMTVNLSGKELTLKIRAMSEEEHKEWQKVAMLVSKKGNVSFDFGKYNSFMLPTCIIEPNFNDADFLKKAKCVSAWDFINSRFPAGVIEDIAQRVQKLSGFETPEKDIEEAKN